MKIVHFKSQIRSGPLTLRLCRLGDLRILHPLLTSEIFPTLISRSKPRSLFFFHSWIKRAFQVIYVIEVKENDGHRMIGFVGLYDMELGRSLNLSLTIFNLEDRKRGYGEKALSLLLSLLQENNAAEVIYAEILKSNVPSLRLCRKLGFKINKLYQDRILLEKDPRESFLRKDFKDAVSEIQRAEAFVKQEADRATGEAKQGWTIWLEPQPGSGNHIVGF
ncbi:MAG: GNAT family N-acetyltransferase [Thermodesulfobacteriota bacterium]